MPVQHWKPALTYSHASYPDPEHSVRNNLKPVRFPHKNVVSGEMRPHPKPSVWKLPYLITIKQTANIRKIRIFGPKITIHIYKMANISEAEKLTDFKINNEKDAIKASKKIKCDNIITGGTTNGKARTCR